MKIAARFSCVIVGLSALTACVDDGYHPLGQGVIGSAYGYQDQQLGAGKYRVSYTGVDAEDGLWGLNKRAEELCKGAGYGGAGFKPSYRASEDLVVASADVTCTKGASKVTAGDSRQAKQAELSALKAEKARLGTGGAMIPGGTAGDLLGGMLDAVDSTDRARIDRRIAELEAELGVSGGASGQGAAGGAGSQCEKSPKCKAAGATMAAYSQRLDAVYGGIGPSIHKMGEWGYCTAKAGQKYSNTCLAEHIALGDQTCAAYMRQGLADLQQMEREALQQAQDTWGGPGVYSPRCP